MKIPKDYIKCIYFDLRTKDYSDHCSDYLESWLKGYISPTISTGNYSIGFELIKPLDKYDLKTILNFDEIEYLEDVSYIPYERNKSIDEFIKNKFKGKCDEYKYMKFLMKYMPEKPILEKLNSVKFTLDIPDEIIKIDKLLQQSNIEKYFDDISANYFTNKICDNIIRKYGFLDVYETKIIGNEIMIYYIQLPYQYRDKREIDRIINNSSNRIQDIVVDNKNSK